MDQIDLIDRETGMPIGGVFKRKARKEHTCRRCRNPILRGERYAEDVNSVGAYESGDRYHLTRECLGAAWPCWQGVTLPLR